MSEMKTLYERLKPEIKDKLLQQDRKYSESVRNIIAKLDSNKFVSELTLSDVRNIHIFSDTDYMDQSAYELMWCEKLFEDDKGND